MELFDVWAADGSFFMRTGRDGLRMLGLHPDAVARVRRESPAGEVVTLFASSRCRFTYHVATARGDIREKVEV